MTGRRKESLKMRRERALALKPILADRYPDLTVSLDWTTPLELLVATILSAQCTDVRVNQVTPALFRRYPTADDYASADREELEELIHSTGFYRNKAKNIQGMAQMVVAEHGDSVPDTMDQLTALPGVARKTANVVLSNAFGRYEGVVVDMAREDWHPFPWRMTLHGRQRCYARKPDCAGCELRDLCPSADRFQA